MMRRILIAATLTCIATAALAQPQPNAESKPCLTQRRIHDFQIVPGNRSLIVVDTARQRYRLNFVGKCVNLQYQFGLAFRSRGVGTLSCIERGDSVLLHESYGPNECFVKNVEYQTPTLDRMDMEAARALRNPRP
jgi:hypothetical protein